MTRPFDVLLLDFGGVCLLNPVELHAAVEDHLGLSRGTLTWTGPLDPGADDLYRQSIEGEITERDYWTDRAAEAGRAAGIELDLRGYMRAVYDPPGWRLIRPDAQRVVEAARVAGIGVSLLTNDLRAFHGEEWVAGMEFLGQLDHLVDCSHRGFLKPDRRAYEAALDVLGVPAERVLFVDDQPHNARAANDVGMHGLWFDIAAPAASWARVADELQLS